MTGPLTYPMIWFGACVSFVVTAGLYLDTARAQDALIGRMAAEGIATSDFEIDLLLYFASASLSVFCAILAGLIAVFRLRRNFHAGALR